MTHLLHILCFQTARDLLSFEQSLSFFAAVVLSVGLSRASEATRISICAVKGARICAPIVFFSNFFVRTAAANPKKENSPRGRGFLENATCELAESLTDSERSSAGEVPWPADSDSYVLC